MAWPVCNTTLEDERITEEPIWDGHTFHTLGLWLSIVFALIALILSLVLIYLHATHYSRPYEQRHIIRILFMVPVYAMVSFLSFLYYNHSVYWEVIRDCYEAFAIASFFSLICAYTAPDLHQQKQYFRSITPKPWIWPVTWFQRCCGGERGCWRTPRSGLTWFNVIWVAIFQYCFIRVAMTITALITQFFDRYCIESLNPAFAHVWVMVIEAMAVTIAMYCLIQFYYQLKEDIAEHKPLLKVIAIKLVIFLSFWQTILISFLTSSGAVKASNTIQTPDLRVGIPAMLLCIEMALFAIFHFWSFPYRPYVLSSKSMLAETHDGSGDVPRRYVGGPLGIKAIIDSMNPWDMVKAIGRAARWMVMGRKRRQEDASYDVALGRKPTNGPAAPRRGEQSSTRYDGAQGYHNTASDQEILLANQQAMAGGGGDTTRYETVPPTDYYNRYEMDTGIGAAVTTDSASYQPYHSSNPSEVYGARQPPPYVSPSEVRHQAPYQQAPYQQAPYQHQTYRPAPEMDGKGSDMY